MTHPLATDLVEFVDEQPPELRTILAHIACCEPCRRGVVNIIQSADGYPDLFARQPSRDCDGCDERDRIIIDRDNEIDRLRRAQP